MDANQDSSIPEIIRQVHEITKPRKKRNCQFECFDQREKCIENPWTQKDFSILITFSQKLQNNSLEVPSRFQQLSLKI